MCQGLRWVFPGRITCVLTKPSDAVGERGAPESGRRPRLGVAGEEVLGQQSTESGRAVPLPGCGVSEGSSRALLSLEFSFQEPVKNPLQTPTDLEPVSPLTSNIAFGKLLDLSEPPFPNF